MISALSLAVGSVAGGFLRYFISNLTARLWGNNFPYGTLIVNLSGCLLIGFLSSAFQGRFALNPQVRLLLMVGFCGAFTTFSAFMLDTAGLIRGGAPLLAFLNIFTSVIVGFFLFWLGVILGKVF